MCSGDGGLKGALHSRGKQTSVAYSAGAARLEPEQVPPMLINGGAARLLFLSPASFSRSAPTSRTQLNQEVFGRGSGPVKGTEIRPRPLQCTEINAANPFH